MNKLTESERVFMWVLVAEKEANAARMMGIIVLALEFAILKCAHAFPKEASV
jgi:hypothetical protein